MLAIYISFAYGVNRLTHGWSSSDTTECGVDLLRVHPAKLMRYLKALRRRHWLDRWVYRQVYCVRP